MVFAVWLRKADIGDWIFFAPVGAGVVNIFEEYVYPGGFHSALRKVVPKMAIPVIYLLIGNLSINLLDNVNDRMMLFSHVVLL